MSTSSDQQPTGAPAGTRQPSTEEIPVVPAGAPARPTTTVQQLPPPGATQAPPPPVAAPQPTGPVGFVPGLPGAGTPPVPPPPAAPAPPPPSAAEPGPDAPPTMPAPDWPASLEDDAPGATAPKKPRAPRDLASVAGPGLAVLALVLLEIGLLLRFGTVSYWSATTLWSAFATAATLVTVIAFVAAYLAGNRLRSSAVRGLAVGGLGGFAVFWLLVVLPDVAGDRGFLLTAALGCLAGALWIGPRRNR